MQKIYFDDQKNLEIVDASGEKDIERLKADFNCPGLVDVTAQRSAKAEQDKLDNAGKNAKETLIQAKIREQAVVALKAEGKLTAAGELVIGS